MRPLVLAWLAHRHLPSWLLPDYFELAAAAALIGSLLALRLATRDGASRIHTARAVACAYVAALVGGYLFEALRALPAAVAAESLRPLAHPGRAAYGGLLFAMAAAALYLRAAREPLAPFFDRVAVGAGLTFALVRTGCFLAGCDYGLPTAHLWGVRFPPGSFAALDHLRRGFVPPGAPSLPVHPTQLYEAALGLCAGACAAIPLARGRRDGSAFSVFLAVTAAGRFAIEFLRGDQDRGHAWGLSTGQWVSVAIVVALSVVWTRRGAAMARSLASSSTEPRVLASPDRTGPLAGATHMDGPHTSRVARPTWGDDRALRARAGATGSLDRS
jgi:phosphatidylglycerol:prolipoprotein diacylglycerol transferase